MLTAKQVETRRSGIGGSDAAQLCGIASFGSPARVYMNKLDIGDPFVTTPDMRWGHILEPHIRDQYAEIKGDRFNVYEIPDTIFHPEHDFMLAHVDGEVQELSPDGEIIETFGLEVKSTNSQNEWMWGALGSDEVPHMYNIQCQHCMAVKGWQRMELVVLIGRSDVRIYRVQRDDQLIENLIKIEGKFWNEHVLPKIMPEIDGSKESSLLLSRIHPKDSGLQREMTGFELDLALQLFDVKKEIKELSAREELYKNRLKESMKEDRKIVSHDGTITWSTPADSKKILYKEIVKELNVPQNVIDKFTETITPTRRFTPTDKRK